MKIPPFKTEPYFQSRPWGGRAMAEILGKKIPDGPVAESWEVSAHPNGVSRAKGGSLDGVSLSDLVREAGKDLLGENVFQKYRGEFPLLVKLIDVNALASVQVHPNDDEAKELEGYPRGKTEAWYIIARSEKARFSLGLVPGTTAENFRAAIGHGQAQALLATPPVFCRRLSFRPARDGSCGGKRRSPAGSPAELRHHLPRLRLGQGGRVRTPKRAARREGPSCHRLRIPATDLPRSAGFRPCEPDPGVRVLRNGRGENRFGDRIARP